MSAAAVPLLEFSAEMVTAGRRELFQTITKHHPSLLKGRVCCPHCGTFRALDPVKLLHRGWSVCTCRPGRAAS
jgi:hypothetical protein